MRSPAVIAALVAGPLYFSGRMAGTDDVVGSAGGCVARQADIRVSAPSAARERVTVTRGRAWVSSSARGRRSMVRGGRVPCCGAGSKGIFPRRRHRRPLPDFDMRIETLAVHAGHTVDPSTRALTPPIHLSSTSERAPDGG